MKRSSVCLLTQTLGRWTPPTLGCAVLLLTTAHPARAGINVWTSHGPGTRPVTTLAIDPITPSTLYAATDADGVQKSIDGGNTWDAANTGLPSPSGVTALAIDPIAPWTLYVATDQRGVSAVFKCTDGGASWSAAYRGPAEVFRKCRHVR